VSKWGSRKARIVLRSLEDIGWVIKRQTGSHKVLSREGWTDYVFAFHEGEEIGPKMMSRIARHTGLEPEDL
jgi:predicted RNA binding protein YcfA (HicA-like mRNA interferase family)